MVQVDQEQCAMHCLVSVFSISIVFSVSSLSSWPMPRRSLLLSELFQCTVQTQQNCHWWELISPSTSYHCLPQSYSTALVDILKTISISSNCTPCSIILQGVGYFSKPSLLALAVQSDWMLLFLLQFYVCRDFALALTIIATVVCYFTMPSLSMTHPKPLLNLE